MAQIEPNQPSSPGFASKGHTAPSSMPTVSPFAPASNGMPSGGTEDPLHYVPSSISTLATGITPNDLDRLISEAMERAEGASDDLLQDSARHQDASRSLTAKQFNSHKRSKLNRKKKQREARGVEEEVAAGKGSAIDGGGAVEGEEQPPGGTRRRRRKNKGKNGAIGREGKGGMEGGGGREGDEGPVPSAGVKRRASGKELLSPKRIKVGLPSSQFTIPARPLTKCARRRYRHKIHMQAAKLPGSGYWASDYVRAKVVKIASVKHFDFSMGAALETGGQWGSYRPKAVPLDGRMQRLKDATKEALNEGTDRGVAGFLDLLIKEEGYRLFEWDGINPTLLVDTEDRVFAVLVGQPDHPSWCQRCERLFELMLQDAPRFATLPRKKTDHHRGAYPSVHTGVTFAPGDQEARNLRLSAKEEDLVSSPEQLRLRGYIQEFVETAFSLFAPRLYEHYTSHMQKLRMHPRYQDLDYSDPYGGFFSMTVNSGPRVVTLPHRDVMNLAYGWCAVVALGCFDPQLGGHLIIHDLSLTFTFPPGSVVLFPSAFLWHSNVPIRKGDQRASITFYSAGTLFRFIDNSFMTETNLERSNEEEYRRRAAEKDRSAATATSLYSKASEIISPSLSPAPSSVPPGTKAPIG